MAAASWTGLCWTTRPPLLWDAVADHMTVATLPEDEDGVEGGVAICCCGCCCWTRCAVGVFTTCVVKRVRGIISQSDMRPRCGLKGMMSSGRRQVAD